MCIKIEYVCMCEVHKLAEDGVKTHIGAATAIQARLLDSVMLLWLLLLLLLQLLAVLIFA